MSKKGFIHCFVSYKGGTGRTVACANIAYQLAKMGKRVLVVDMDIDGPGMAVTADLPKETVKERSIVRFLKSPDMPYQNFIIRREISTTERATPVVLDFLVAPLSADAGDALPTHGSELAGKISRLRNSLLSDYDVVLIDSASGMSDYTALAFSISDFVTICMRYSRQHFEGSLRFIHLIGGLKRSKRYFLKDFFVLASAVPEPTTGFEFKRRDDVLEEVAAVCNLLKGNAPPITEKIEIIREFSELKWFEEILTRPSPAFDDYQNNAAMCSSQYNRWHEAQE